MALQKTAITPQGFEATNAYHRVEGVRLTKKDELAFNVRGYKDASEANFFLTQSSYAPTTFPVRTRSSRHTNTSRPFPSSQVLRTFNAL